MNTPLCTEKEACSILNIKLSTLVKMRNTNKIKYVKIGSNIRYLKEDINSYALCNRSVEQIREVNNDIFLDL